MIFGNILNKLILRANHTFLIAINDFFFGSTYFQIVLLG